MVVHHHSIVVATVLRPRATITCEGLQSFLSGLVKAIDMQQLFDPIAINGKYGFTGIVGIVTSHIAFHYFDEDRTLHLDVYSCKPYDLAALIDFVNEYWDIETASVLFIRRDEGPSIESFVYADHQLRTGGDYAG